MIDVAVAIDEEAEPVVWKAVASGTWNSVGKWVPGISVETSIPCVIQPARGTALMDMPEGIRHDAEWLGWSRTAVKTNDEIVYQSVRYRVMFVWPRVMDGFTRFALGRMTP
jgi:hypothetical protein